MKLLLNTIFATILLGILGGCQEREQANNDLITIDVSKNYPKKELILQDFMDVEYIALETTDKFLTQGFVKDVGKEYILVTNRFKDGDIFLFDRKTGKGIRKINRQGQGTEEYTRISEVILDENHGEIFVKSLENKIIVYDLIGNFKRCLNIDREISSIFDYNRENLIGYDRSEYHNKGKDRSKAYHVLISKQNGSITQEIYIPFNTINTPIVVDGNNFIANYSYPTRLSHGKCMLMDTSSDTLYNYTSEGKLKPFMIRTPSINNMNPEIFLYMGIDTERYCFMETIENTFNFKKGNGFYPKVLMYDKEKKTFYQVTIYNNDYVEKRTVAMTGRSINHEVEAVSSIDASQLVELYKNGKLKNGELKEIASRLNEEANPVVMIVKQKKEG